jgi:ABC-2 type transport system permease protein
MTNIWVLARRELSAFFFSPIAYLVAFFFLICTGVYFAFYGPRLEPGAEATMESLFMFMIIVLTLFVPPLTMRLLAEELRSGTVEMLMTAPVTDIEVVLGKFLGALLFYLVLLVPTLGYLVILRIHSHLDYGPILAGYLGLVLIGGLYISVGTFFSALSRYQIVAAVASIVVLFVFAYIIGQASLEASGSFRSLLQLLSVEGHYRDFARGVFDTSHLIYFISGIVFFLFLTVKVVESRKWR